MMRCDSHATRRVKTNIMRIHARGNESHSLKLSGSLPVLTEHTAADSFARRGLANQICGRLPRL